MNRAGCNLFMRIEVFHILLSYVISAIMEENVRFWRGDSLCDSNVFIQMAEIT